jgi:hypothetical protein
MNKIASPKDLERELRTLLVYARTAAPSRAHIAAALDDLSDRVAAGVVAKKNEDAEYQASDEYKTGKDRDYYPQQAPAGMKYPKELSRLGDLKSVVMGMFEEDLDKDRSYRHPMVKKLQKAVAKRLKDDDGFEQVRKEFGKLEELKGDMVMKSMSAKTDAEGDPYRFAARKLYHAWQGYNAAIGEYSRNK